MIDILIKLLILIVSIILIVFIFGMIITHTKDDKEIFDVDYVIVLGHKLVNDKANDVLIERLDKTVEYLKINKNTKVLLSGGITESNTLSEAAVMSQYLIDNGVNQNTIILENESKDTIENFYNCKKIIKDRKVLIISSRYHLFRARMICKMFNINAVAIGTKVCFIEILKHAFIEAVFIFIHYFRIKKNYKEQNV